jgi:peptidoglycan hydrolase-like protein with peptidoglycan-binding domain
MASPVPSNFKITTVYRRPGKHWSCGYHTGVDFAVPTGTQIFAAKDGKVLEAGSGVSWGGSYGNAIIIDHGDGVRAIYAHLSVIDVKKGDSVTEGQPIGKSGNSGNSTGPHLHFEARVSPWKYANKDVDPAGLLSGVKTTLAAKVAASTPDKRDTGAKSGPNPEFPGKAFGPGATGAHVRFLQEKLKIAVTGTFDDATKNAVIAVQKANKALGKPDGIVGPMTWKHITK